MAALAAATTGAARQGASTTQAQRAQLCRAYLARKQGLDDGWVRARTHGERVTLASLYYRHLLARRCHSGAGTSSPAHEYKLHEALYRSMLDAVHAKQVAQGEAAMYRGGDTVDQRSGMSATDEAAPPAAPDAAGSDQVTPDPKPGGGKAPKSRSPRSGGKGKGAGAAAKKGGAAAKKDTAAKPKAAGKPRAVKTSKDAKAARAEMDTHKVGYKAYTDAQVAKAKAAAAGDEVGTAKQQKVMDKNRAAYTAHRAAYRKYQAAPEK